MKFTNSPPYRSDIDGLRAYAVLPVIAFHLGLIENGFLGVDVFFVISGFLITNIIYQEMEEQRFSIQAFYLRRIRRILPLALFVTSISLILGSLVMLPDDLENLAQSAIASNLFSNNILQAITTKNYWDVVNEFKPLMHTWSLGVEEQFYIAFPLLLLLFKNKKKSLLLPVVLGISLISFILYVLPIFSHFHKFYFIFFRFWELSIGGAAAIALHRRLINHKYILIAILSLVALLVMPKLLPDEISLILVVLLSLIILISFNESSTISNIFLQNKIVVYIGKISFSLYMWHQVVFAFNRYLIKQEFNFYDYFILTATVFLLSILTYYFIEQPFRNKKLVSTKVLLISTAILFITSSIFALYIYQNSGVLKDVPELGIYKNEITKGMHSKYNHNIYNYDREFSSNNKIKVLVTGNSFARDWANVLLESKHANEIEISYIYDINSHPDLKSRLEISDVIFVSTPDIEEIKALNFPEEKLWAVGTKNFGISNGVFYNYSGDGYFNQRTSLEKGYLEKNQLLKATWNDRYLDYIEKVIDANGRVPVFTPNKMFISQDCRHLTQAGAQYFSDLFSSELSMILKK